jgi:iron complex transport system substrate-binding protein
MTHRHLVRFCICIALSAVALSGCKSIRQSSAVDARTRAIVDMTGRSVAIPVEVDRVAANGMSLTQLLLLLGADHKIVAIMPSIKADPWYMRVFPHLRSVPAPFLGAEVNIESLMSANPQVVFLWTGTDALRTKIEAMGIPVVSLSYSDPDGLKKAVSIMGNVLGVHETVMASKFIDYYDGNVKRVQAKTESLPMDSRPRVYYAAGAPLNTEGQGSIVDAWIRIAGGVNVAARAGLLGSTILVSLEDIENWNPEVIVVRDISAFHPIADSQRWDSIDAVHKHRVYVNPKGVNVWSARSGDGALQILWAAKTLHPELFRDIDMKTEVYSFYKTFYHYQLSDEELKSVFQGTPPPQ